MSSKAIEVSSAAQLHALIESTEMVMVAVHKDNSPILSTIEMIVKGVIKPGRVAFAKCDANKHQDVAAQYNVTVDPTYLIFRSGVLARRLEGQEELEKHVKETFDLINTSRSSQAADSSSSDNTWRGSQVPKSYSDVTQYIELVGLDIMNANSEFGGVRTLFEPSIPSSLSKGKKANDGSASTNDWVESDTDEQLMLFIPFQTQCKVHSLQITSLPPAVDDDDDDEIPSRPKTIKLYANTPQILSFDDAEGREPTQVITLGPKDWDPKTGTATVATRFVKFQSVSSFTVFFFDVERDGAEKVRIDRIRIMGEQLHEKMDMSKLKAEQE